MAVSAIASDFDYDIRPEILAALDRQDTTGVLNLLNEEIKLDPAYAPHYFIKGRIYFARQQLTEALAEFDLALKKKSKLYEALYYKGLTLLQQGNLDEAEKAFDKGLKKAKDEKASFHNGMGLLLLEKKEYSRADVEFRKAITIGPDRAEFHANLGDANYFVQFYPLAISEYNAVIEMDTSFLDVYFRLARAYVAQGQYNDALDQLRVVLTRDSMYTFAWEEIGRLYTMAGLSANDRETKVQRFTEAIGSYHKFLELSNDSSRGEVFFNIGRSYFNLGGFPQADSAFEHVVALGDVPKNIYLYLGRGYIAEQRFPEGIETLDKHLAWMKEQDPEWEPGPGEADIFRRIGDGYKANEDWPNAAENYVRASELAPSDARLAVEAAVAYHQLKDHPQALHYYEKRIELGPDSWNVYMNAAYCTLNMEDLEKSAEYLLKVVELDSTKVKAYSLLSNTYLHQLQDCENGVKWTQKWLDKDSVNCEALKGLGFAYFGGICTTNYLKAIDYFKRALSCFKAKGIDNCGNTDIIVYIAQAYHLHAAELLENDKKEESKPYFKNAFDWYNKCLKCDPGNADCKQGIRDTEFEF
jgi:tetratricopeptide (TPR) repeat protein